MVSEQLPAVIRTLSLRYSLPDDLRHRLPEEDVYKRQTQENCLKMLKACKEEGAMIVLGSDSHVDVDIANCQYAAELVKKADFPEELVANSSLEKLKASLKRNKKV